MGDSRSTISNPPLREKYKPAFNVDKAASFEGRAVSEYTFSVLAPDPVYDQIVVDGGSAQPIPAFSNGSMASVASQLQADSQAAVIQSSVQTVIPDVQVFAEFLPLLGTARYTIYSNVSVVDQFISTAPSATINADSTTPLDPALFPDSSTFAATENEKVRSISINRSDNNFPAIGAIPLVVATLSHSSGWSIDFYSDERIIEKEFPEGLSNGTLTLTFQNPGFAGVINIQYKVFRNDDNPIDFSDAESAVNSLVDFSPTD